MSSSGLHLLPARRFGPLFLTQFLNAFNDNLYRTAMLFVIAFQIVPGKEALAGTWAVVAAAICVLPYFLFSSLAGELAERMDKARLARILRAIDVGLMAIAAIALVLGSLALMLAMLFGTGIRAVFFGPLKYSVLPQHLPPAELMGATGLMQTGSFFAAIVGQMAGALLPYSVTAAALIAVSLCAFFAACSLASSLRWSPMWSPPRRTSARSCWARSALAWHWARSA